MKEAYLWDIFINEVRRGRGYGKEAMRELRNPSGTWELRAHGEAIEIVITPPRD